jgi:toluene monooxygenase system protein D
MSDDERVGPVLCAGNLADAMIAVIRENNQETVVEDRGGYRRVSAPGRCILLRAALEEALGQPVHLPSALEKIMSSFRGRLALSDDEARWER